MASGYDTYLASLSPVAWWKLADASGASHAADSSSLGTHALTPSGVTFGSDAGPIIGSGQTAATMAGPGSTSGLTSATAIVSTGVPWSVVGWFKCSTVSGTNPGPEFFSTRWTGSGTSNTDTFDFGFGSATQIHGDIGNGASSWKNTSVNFTISSITDSKWHMVVEVVTSTGIQCFLDGSSINTISGSLSTAFLSKGSNVYCVGTLGWNGGSGGTQSFQGDIAQVAVFTSALTATNVSQLWGLRQGYAPVRVTSFVPQIRASTR